MAYPEGTAKLKGGASLGAEPAGGVFDHIGHGCSVGAGARGGDRLAAIGSEPQVLARAVYVIETRAAVASVVDDGEGSAVVGSPGDAVEDGAFEGYGAKSDAAVVQEGKSCGGGGRGGGGSDLGGAHVGVCDGFSPGRVVAAGRSEQCTDKRESMMRLES
jgi:hypothetical protein